MHVNQMDYYWVLKTVTFGSNSTYKHPLPPPTPPIRMGWRLRSWAQVHGAINSPGKEFLLKLYQWLPMFLYLDYEI